MEYSIRTMRADEIGLIEGIDRSEDLREEYVCSAFEGALGLTLERRPVDPPRHIRNWSRRELQSRFALWRGNIRDGAVLTGAFAGGELVGFVLATAQRDAGTGEIYSLFVDRRHRGKGIGSDLLREAESQCRARGCPALVVHTGHSAPAVDFYLRRGFRIVGIREPRFATRGFDLTMARELCESEAPDWADEG